MQAGEANDKLIPQDFAQTFLSHYQQDPSLVQRYYRAFEICIEGTQKPISTQLQAEFSVDDKHSTSDTTYALLMPLLTQELMLSVIPTKVSEHCP